jgi:glycosyltransferase involved in cell wall biosynthesis
MRVLMLHNKYLLHGGEDISCAMDVALLRNDGHDVELYEETNAKVESIGSVRAGARAIWSRDTFHRVRRLVRQNKCEVVHVQNFFPLISPSAYYAARAEGAAVVQSLRNYRLICPASNCLRNGRVCEDCVGKAIAWPGVVHACYRGSATATAAVATMLAVHHGIGTWRRRVDAFICLTRFGREKFVSAGLPADKIAIKPNFVHPDPGVGPGGGGFALFVGRLDVQKGVDVVLAAWEAAATRPPIKILGDGPLAERVRAVAARVPGIEWLGHRSLDETYRLMQTAEFLILPSVSYEGFPRVVVEGFACGTPVIASRISPMTELIEDGVTGLLFDAGNAGDLWARVTWATTHPAELSQMRRNARLKFEADFTAEKNGRILAAIYAAAIERARQSH